MPADEAFSFDYKVSPIRNISYRYNGSETSICCRYVCC